MLFANVNVLTMDEARRISGNIAKPPKLTYPIRRHGPKGAHAFRFTRFAAVPEPISYAAQAVRASPRCRQPESTNHATATSPSVT